jgi:hypothetical protein
MEQVRKFMWWGILAALLSIPMALLAAQPGSTPPEGMFLPRPTSSSAGGGVRLPDPVRSAEGAVGPQVASVTLWDQPLSASNTNAYANQDFEPGFDPYDIYISDDFTNASPWTIRSIFVPGGGWNGFTSLMNATSITWSIYADAGGVPAGYPGGGSAPFWTITLPPGDPQITLSVGTFGNTSNAQLTLTTPIVLPDGHWWLVYYPSLAFSGGGQFGRQTADTTNGAVAKVINPGGGFGFPGVWTDVTSGSTWGAGGLTQTDSAFRLDGQDCGGTITIAMSALGGTTVDWPVAHGSEPSRLFRDGIPSTCVAPKPSCPGTTGSGGYAYDAFTFSNAGAAPACVTTTLATACTGTNYLFAVAYLGPFNPASICTNYLADIGGSPNGSPVSMSFTVPAGGVLTLVVNEATSGGGCPSGYTLTVDGLPCPSTCPAITLSPATLPVPIQGVPYSQTITASGGTGPYTFAVTAGTLPTGLTLSAAGLLSGTMTALAPTAFTVTATDANGCTGNQAYSVSTYSAFFKDDMGRSLMCVNRLTGAYTYQILVGPGVGIYTGTCTVMNGGAKYVNQLGAPDKLNVTYDPVRRKASGYFIAAGGAYSGLSDANTANNTGGCP